MRINLQVLSVFNVDNGEYFGVYAAPSFDELLAEIEHLTDLHRQVQEIGDVAGLEFYEEVNAHAVYGQIVEIDIAAQLPPLRLPVREPANKSQFMVFAGSNYSVAPEDFKGSGDLVQMLVLATTQCIEHIEASKKLWATGGNVERHYVADVRELKNNELKSCFSIRLYANNQEQAFTTNVHVNDSFLVAHQEVYSVTELDALENLSATTTWEITYDD